MDIRKVDRHRYNSVGVPPSATVDSPRYVKSNSAAVDSHREDQFQREQKIALFCQRARKHKPLF
jgi:hypothetical protein